MIDAKQYNLNKKRLAKAEKVMEEGDKWNDPKYKSWVETYSRILEDNLEFESFHKIDWAIKPKEDKDEKQNS